MDGKCIRRAVLFMIFCLTACGGQNNAATQNNIFPQDNAAAQSVFPQDGAAIQIASVQDDAAAQGASQPDSALTGDAGREQEESREVAALPQAPEERQGHDWRTEEWQIGEEAAWDGQLYAGEYIYGLEASPERAYAERRSLYQTWGHRFYALEEYTTEDGESFYYMNSYDSFTGEILHWPLEFSCPEEYAGCEVRLANFDIQTEAEWVVFLQIWPDEEMEEPIAYLAVHLSPEGGLLSWVDLYPIIKEYGGRLYHYIHFDSYVDRQGYYYLILTRWPDPADPTQQHRGGEFLDSVYILDPEGRLEAEMRPLSGKYPEFSTKTPDGTPIFDWKFSTTYFWMMYHDREAGQSREVMEKVGSKDSWTGHGWAGTLTEDGYLYFLDNSMRLSRCDLYTGKRDYCLKYGRLGLGNKPAYIYMVPGPEGDPVILDTMDENGAVICRLTRQEPQTDPIRLVSFTENCTLLEN